VPRFHVTWGTGPGLLAPFIARARQAEEKGLLGSIAYGRAKREPAVYGGKGMALAGIILGAMGFLTLPFLGTFAALAIPNALRARVATNESGAIGDVRTVISAEAAYQSANGGYYDTPECLGAPAKCIPHYTGEPFLKGPLADENAVTNGYRHTFHIGEQAQIVSTVSATSLRSYAFVAEPATRGQTGVRAFCGDDGGRVCVWPDGQPTKITGGRCPADCRPLN